MSGLCLSCGLPDAILAALRSDRQVRSPFFHAGHGFRRPGPIFMNCPQRMASIA